jgi:hypothetical protein
MNDLLKITEDLTKRIIDMPDGPVEILRVRRALSQSMRWCVRDSRRKSSFITGVYAGLAGTRPDNRGHFRVKGSRIATGVLH